MVLNLTTEFVEKLGPLVDGVVGTAGTYQDLYEAMVAGGGPQWRNVIVVDGCTMTQAVTITNTGISIVSLHHFITIGAYTLRLEGADIVLKNIRLSGATGNGVEIAASRCKMFQCEILSNSGIGIKCVSGYDDHDICNCVVWNNGDDGIEIDDGVLVRCVSNRISSNVGWGIDDNNAATDNSMFIGNVILGNTAGNLSTNAAAAYKISNLIT